MTEFKGKEFTSWMTTEVFHTQVIPWINDMTIDGWEFFQLNTTATDDRVIHTVVMVKYD